MQIGGGKLGEKVEGVNKVSDGWEKLVEKSTNGARNSNGNLCFTLVLSVNITTHENKRNSVSQRNSNVPTFLFIKLFEKRRVYERKNVSF